MQLRTCGGKIRSPRQTKIKGQFDDSFLLPISGSNSLLPSSLTASERKRFVIADTRDSSGHTILLICVIKRIDGRDPGNLYGLPRFVSQHRSLRSAARSQDQPFR